MFDKVIFVLREERDNLLVSVNGLVHSVLFALFLDFELSIMPKKKKIRKKV